MPSSFAALLEAVPEAITTLGRDGRIKDFKPERGIPTPQARDAMIGRHLREFTHVPSEKILSGLEEAFRSGRMQELAYDAMVQGEVRNREARIIAVGDDEAMLIVRDVTEERRLQSRLFLADRIAALGTLAAGVGHELNNPLAYVIGNLEFVRHTLGAAVSEEVREALDAALEGSERMAAIVRDLHALSRPDDGAATFANPEAILQKAIQLTQRTVGRNAAVELDLGGVREVRLNEGRLTQVFVNLLLNAQAACAARAQAGQQGTIVVRTRNRGDDVLIEVVDDGPGIAPEDLTRIFDPFFTTKGPGGGTGLGLSICQEIVRSANGSIEAVGSAGGGATFRVLLPARAPADGPVAAVAVSPEIARRRILVIDDDNAVGVAVCRVLDVQHESALASSGAAGLERLAKESFDLVVCDLAMPGLNGIDVLEALHAPSWSWPGPPAQTVLMTGGVPDAAVRVRLAGLGVKVLTKPFRLRDVNRLFGG